MFFKHAVITTIRPINDIYIVGTIFGLLQSQPDEFVIFNHLWSRQMLFGVKGIVTGSKLIQEKLLFAID